MDISYLSLIGAFAMLVIGVLDYAILQHFLYQPLRQNFESAKVTADKKLDPDTIWMGMKLVNFVAMPVTGFIFGDAVLRPFVG